MNSMKEPYVRRLHVLHKPKAVSQGNMATQGFSLANSPGGGVTRHGIAKVGNSGG